MRDTARAAGAGVLSRAKKDNLDEYVQLSVAAEKEARRQRKESTKKKSELVCKNHIQLTK